MKLSQIEWITVGKAAAKEYAKDDVPGLSAEMAYHFVFALFPFIIFLAALAGFLGSLVGVNNVMDNITAALYTALPPATAGAIQEPLSAVLTDQRAGVLSLGAALALWSASNGVATVMKAFNRAYGMEEGRSFLVRRLLAIGLTLVLSLFIISGFVLLLLGDKIGGWLAAQLGLGDLFVWVWQVVRVVAALAGISLALALLYWKGPNVDQQFQWITLGSAVATLLWVLMTLAFGVYVQVMGASSYSQTYGTAFGLILFLLYLYLTSMVILLGAELNAETTKRYDPHVIKDKLTDPRKQLPGKQPPPHPQAAAEAGVSPQEVVATNRTSAAKLVAGHGSPTTATAAARARTGHGAALAAGDGRGHGESPPHRDRTTLATIAVSAAAVLAAAALGALSRRETASQ